MPRRLQTYSNDTLTVTYAPERCIHAAACVRALPIAFAPKERPWIRMDLAESERIAEAVARCPTGALQLQWNDGREAAAPDDGITIQLQHNGPLYVRGPVRLESEMGGEAIAEDTRMALCRCGQSRNAPFCDGTHRTVRFDDRPA